MGVLGCGGGVADVSEVTVDDVARDGLIRGWRFGLDVLSIAGTSPCPLALGAMVQRAPR